MIATPVPRRNSSSHISVSHHRHKSGRSDMFHKRADSHNHRQLTRSPRLLDMTSGHTWSCPQFQPALPCLACRQSGQPHQFAGLDRTTRSCQIYVHLVSLGTRSCPDWGWDAMGVFLRLEVTGRARAVTTKKGRGRAGGFAAGTDGVRLTGGLGLAQRQIARV